MSYNYPPGPLVSISFQEIAIIINNETVHILGVPKMYLTFALNFEAMTTLMPRILGFPASPEPCNLF